MKRTVCLINPPHPYLYNPDAQAPLGLLYIASSLRDYGCDVKFLNLTANHHTDIGDVIFPGCDIYGITGTVLDRRSIVAVAERIRQQDPYATIVVGGPITLSRGYFDKGLIDAYVVGEGEYVMRDIVDEYPVLAPVYYASRIDDLDSIPLPARDLLDGNLGENIFAGRYDYYSGGSTVICSSRGCPNVCKFCASVKLWGRRVIYRSAANVAHEIQHVIDTYNVRQFRFSDDNLTSSRSRLETLMTTLKGMDIAWRASVRVKPSSVAMFTAMRDAGCREVCFGVESADQNVLNVLDKAIKVDDTKKAIIDAHEAGLVVRLLLMTGTPGETVETTDSNIRFLSEMYDYYDSVSLTNFTPLPGTAVADDPESVGCEILDYDIDHYNLCLWRDENDKNPWLHLIRPLNMSLDELSSAKSRMTDFVIQLGKINRG